MGATQLTQPAQPMPQTQPCASNSPNFTSREVCERIGHQFKICVSDGAWKWPTSVSDLGGRSQRCVFWCGCRYCGVRADEDELCALHLRNLLEGRSGDPQALRRVILAGGATECFRDPTRPHLLSGDLDIALDIDRYGFAIAVTLEAGRPVARMERGN